MKVSDLIEQLQKLPQDAVVVKHGYEDHYDSVGEIEVKRLLLDAYPDGHLSGSGTHVDEDHVNYTNQSLTKQGRLEEAKEYDITKCVDAVLID